MSVKEGDKVKIEYAGTLDDGTIFDSSEKHGKPLEFEVGAKQVIKGFENAVIGMEEGEEKEFRLEPAEAYGDYRKELIKKVPKDKLPKEKELKKGMMLMMKLPNGMQIPATIIEAGDTEITIDINHPLAGKALNFKIKIAAVN